MSAKYRSTLENDPDPFRFFDFWGKWFYQGDRKDSFRADGTYTPFELEGGYCETFNWRMFKGHPNSFEAGPMDENTATEDMFLYCLRKCRDWLREQGLQELSNFPSENHILRIKHYRTGSDKYISEARPSPSFITINTEEGTGEYLTTKCNRCDGTGELGYGGPVCPQCNANGPVWFPVKSDILVGEMLDLYTEPRKEVGTRRIGGSRKYYRCHALRTCIAPMSSIYMAQFLYLPSMNFELHPTIPCRGCKGKGTYFDHNGYYKCSTCEGTGIKRAYTAGDFATIAECNFYV